MKAEPGFLRGFFLVLGIIACAALYVAMVLFPIVEDISQLRRDKKDLVLRIEDFKNQAHRFFVIDQKEANLIKRESTLLMDRLPVASSPSEIEVMLEEAMETIRRLAAELQMADSALVLADGSADLPEIFGDVKANPSGESTDTQWMFPFSSVSGKLHIAVSAPLPQLLRFLNRLPVRRKQYMEMGEIRFEAGIGNPLMILSVNLYFCGAGGCDPVDLVEYARKKGIVIDYNSEILLERVYWYTEKEIERRALPEIADPRIFRDRRK